MIDSSFDVFRALGKLGYPKELRDPYWWPNSGRFEVVAGAILTQNTRWENVEMALTNLRTTTPIELDSIIELELELLASLIRPSGFYNQKAIRLKALCSAIKEEFGEFEAFRESVSREWLLAQKGIGFESADSILCYGCYRDEMVADKYTHKLLRSLGVEIDEYEEIKSFLQKGIDENITTVEKMLGYSDIAKTYALFHGMIVEYSKDNPKLKNIDKLKGEI
ncbi:MAG: 3-methyladenine DNA glycosylase [Campylobacterales bacterium]